MSIYSSEGCDTCDKKGHLVKIVARTRFLGEQISIFLEEHTGARCKIYNSLQELSGANSHREDEDPLILLEANQQHISATHRLCAEIAELTNSHHLLAIFNTPKSTRFEKDALSCGIRGIFHEDDHPEDLIKGVCSITQGEIWVSRKIMSECFIERQSVFGKSDSVCKPELDSLTARQKTILSLIAAGASNQAIADKLCISTHTVKTHIYNIFKKINVPSRTQAALWAAKNL